MKKLLQFFEDDSGHPSTARLMSFFAFLLAAWYFIYNDIHRIPIDQFNLIILLGYSASVKVFQKLVELNPGKKL